MIKIPIAIDTFHVPRIVFTLRGNSSSEQVIHTYHSVLFEDQTMSDDDPEWKVFETAEEIRAMFEGGLSPNAAVGLFDDSISGEFHFLTRLRSNEWQRTPAWMKSLLWGIVVARTKDDEVFRRALNCAQQLRVAFQRRFAERLAEGCFPWGFRRKNELPPAHVKLPEGTDDLVRLLNSGPNLRANVNSLELAAELPTDARISWFRIAPEPIVCDVRRLTAITDAMRAFEQAGAKLLRENDAVHREIFAGVHLADPRLTEHYLFPGAESFSIARPDLHYTGEGLFASENDEMPGGFPEVMHIDLAYGVNQDRWNRAFAWLFERGPAIFLVSHEWSKVYVEETRWLAEYLRARGYPAHVATTDQMGDLAIGDDAVTWKGERVGTVWRQFPIFETAGKLVDLVIAARDGAVRLVPEFAHFGNKVWFSLFTRHRDWFRTALVPEVFTLLKQVLPDSHLVDTADAERLAGSFPCHVAGATIGSMERLRTLPADVRDRIVLKVVGANTLSARSYGVLMGHGLTDATWREWIDERIMHRQPFIVQRRIETGVARVPVLNTSRGQNAAELFNCRLLLRPWVVNGEVISVHGCAVPSNTLRVHGRVDMAIIPVNLEETI